MRRSYLVGPPCPSSCPCRTASRETPIADLVYGMGANSLRSLEEQRADERSLSAQFIAAFDAMQEFHRAEAKRRAGGVGSSTEDGTRASAPERATEQSVPPASPQPEKKLRVPSKKELKRRKAEREGRAMTPSWLLEEDPMVEAIIRGQPDADS
jgi:hypothetical protein